MLDEDLSAQIYVRVAPPDGTRRYCYPVYTASGKLRPQTDGRLALDRFQQFRRLGIQSKGDPLKCSKPNLALTKFELADMCFAQLGMCS